MNLTWKDAVTTALVIIIGTLYYTKLNGALPLNISNRWFILLLGFMGILMCAMSSAVTKTSPYTFMLTALGIIALTTIIIGLITGKQLFVMLLVAEIVLLWLLSTIRHAFNI